MYKKMRKAVVLICILWCLCTAASAIYVKPVAVIYDGFNVEMAEVLRATGSFNVSVRPNSRSKGDTDFPLEAGETVRIYAVYSPENASLDFGLVDPNGIFHYLSGEDGVFDKTFEVPQRGNYRLGIKNNSGVTVQVSGFVKY